MRRLVHLSDLHFGRDRNEVLAPLTRAVNALKSDLVVISGDFTQRATAVQFEAAKAFLGSLDAPTLSVPGNHDVPLHNILVRILMPWRRYRRWIDRNLEPQFIDDEIVVFGINTVNPFEWQRGWFRTRSVERICTSVGAATGDARTHIIVAHHPLEHLPGGSKSLMRGAATSLRKLTECGIDAVLTGHLHNWHAGPFAIVAGRASALQVHAGTTLSDRLRGEINDFNVLDIECGRMTVTRQAFDDGSASFSPMSIRTFLKGQHGWHQVAITPE